MFDRSLWKETISPDRCPPWPCHACKGGTLALKPKSFRSWETAESKRGRRDENWEPDWICELFSCVLQCASCKEVSIASGESTWVNEYIDDVGQHGIALEYEPRLVLPAPTILPTVAGLPDEASRPLVDSFGLYWADPPAAASRIRTSLERYLDSKKIPKKARSKKGGMARLSLHARIQRFKSPNPQVTASLLAIKWLGNDGAHDDQLSREDVLDAYEILHDVLPDLVGTRKKTQRLVNSIVRKRGRVRR